MVCCIGLRTGSRPKSWVSGRSCGGGGWPGHSELPGKGTFCRHGAAELDLIVDADNTQALSLYQKTGFQILEENRCYISQSKIAADGSCMEKETSV